MPALIEVQDLTKEFRSFRRREGVWGALQNLFVREHITVRAVESVSFSIEAGEMVGYIGANGAGKSTTVKMLTGILVPTSGRMVANGYVPYRDRRHYTRHIGVVFGQRTQLWWDIAVIESFKLLKEIYEVSDADFRRRLGVFSEILNLKSYLNTPVRKLSLGERMRCDIAASLLHNPPVLFLDEPTIGLDVVAKDRIREFLKEVNRMEHTTVLLTTHDLSDIEELCKRIIVIDRGKILFDGALREMKARLAKYNQVKFILKDRSQVAGLARITTDGISCDRQDELTYLMRFDRERYSNADIIRNIVTTLEVSDILVEEEPIEDIVKRIYLSGEVG
ncbi:MAG TPA: ATP-binding cassette domain-containing protein [Terriglobia bacterium]|nr:ATP-binding cassette domain-containing protein [Terriglobia bacterium]